MKGVDSQKITSCFFSNDIKKAPPSADIKLYYLMDTNKLKNLAKDLTKDFPRSPRETIAGYVLAGRALNKCRATIAGTAGEYHFNCPLDNFFFGFAEISGEEFKEFVATGVFDEEVAKWIEEKAKKRPRLDIIKWNNDIRYKRISEMPDGIQEYMEDYIPEFIPSHLRHHIDYFFRYLRCRRKADRLTFPECRRGAER